MNKKLMAVAVAGALAAPGIAMAQSSVTISGYFKAGYDNVRISGATAAGARTQSSENRITDHSSRILFNVTEDLGGGLQAIAQMDMRFTIDGTPLPSSQGYAGAVGGGNTWVGLRSKTWGTLTFGKHDLHYGKAGDETANKAGSLQLIADSLMGSIMRPGVGTASLANQTRTVQVMRWDSPQWGIFSGTIAWSANPQQAGGGGGNVEGDLHTATTGVFSTNPGDLGTIKRRKGNGWMFNPKLTGSNWFAEWSHWRSKQDLNNSSNLTFAGVNTTFNPAASRLAVTGAAAAAATTTAQVFATPIQDEQRSNTLAGWYRWGGFKLGLAYNNFRTTNVASGLTSGDRRAWAIPMSYTWGNHSVAGHYTRARNSKDVQIATVTVRTTVAAPTVANGGITSAVATVSGADTGAHMWAIAYDYSLSKRTTVGLSYGQLRNKTAGTYTMFYNAQTAFGSASSASQAGEDSRLFAATIRHNF